MVFQQTGKMNLYGVTALRRKNIVKKLYLSFVSTPYQVRIKFGQQFLQKNKEHSIQNAPYIFFIKTCQLQSCLIFKVSLTRLYKLSIFNFQFSIIYTLVRSWRRLCSPDLLYPCRRRSMLLDGRFSLLARCASRQGYVISNIM